MDKPLTVEELKVLEVGDWVWVVDLMYNKGMYCRKGKAKKVNTSIDGIVYNSLDKAFCVVGYGTEWVAYKNKEQTEDVEQAIKNFADKLLKTAYYGYDDLNKEQIYAVDAADIKTILKEFINALK